MAPSKILGILAVACGLQSVRAAPALPNSGLIFDYVIVGSGPGGLTVASRLTEDPRVSVAVVEAGTWSESVTGNQSQVPAYDYYYNGKSPNDTNPLVDWGFVTTPQAVSHSSCPRFSTPFCNHSCVPRASTIKFRTTLVANR